VEDSPAAVASFERDREKGEGEGGSAWLYRRAAAAYKEGEQGRGQDSVAFHTGAGDLPFVCAPLPGRWKERGTGKKRKGREAVLTGGTRGQ